MKNIKNDMKEGTFSIHTRCKVRLVGKWSLPLKQSRKCNCAPVTLTGIQRLGMEREVMDGP